MANLDSDLTNHFPEYRNEIPLLLSQDITFREIAEDYMFCKKELQRLELTKNKALITQYSDTTEDLKDELITRLKDYINMK